MSILRCHAVVFLRLERISISCYTRAKKKGGERSALMHYLSEYRLLSSRLSCDVYTYYTFNLLEHNRYAYHLLFVNRTGTGENLTIRIDRLKNNHALIIATRYIATYVTAVHWQHWLPCLRLKYVST